jgi:hypothetical protein
MRAPAKEATMSGLERMQETWAAKPRALRELAIFLLFLSASILLMPLLIHAIGRETLGEYESGGAAALLGDFVRALGRGALSFWAVALGPYVFFQLARFAFVTARRQRATS